MLARNEQLAEHRSGNAILRGSLRAVFVENHAVAGKQVRNTDLRTVPPANHLFQTLLCNLGKMLRFWWPGGLYYPCTPSFASKTPAAAGHADDTDVQLG